MSKLACHGHNFKKGAVGGMDRHNRRLGDRHSNDEIDPARTPLNLTYKGTDNLYQECKAEVERVKANGGRLRSDQNWLTEFTIYAPKEPMSYQEYQRYFQEVYNFFKELVGDENIKLAVAHMDEKTPHMHLDFVPLIRDERGEPARLSSKDVVTRRFLRGIQDNLPKRLQEHGFDVQRGDKVTVEDRPLKGRSARKYKADMEREKVKLEKEIDELTYDYGRQVLEYENEADQMSLELRRTEQEIASKAVELEKLENQCKILLSHSEILEIGLRRCDEAQEVLDMLNGIKELLPPDFERVLAPKIGQKLHSVQKDIRMATEISRQRKADGSHGRAVGEILKKKPNNHNGGGGDR